MPRIEICEPDPDPHDGSPTIDVCRRCARDFNEGDPIIDSDITDALADKLVGCGASTIEPIIQSAISAATAEKDSELNSLTYALHEWLDDRITTEQLRETVTGILRTQHPDGGTAENE